MKPRRQPKEAAETPDRNHSTPAAGRRRWWLGAAVVVIAAVALLLLGREAGEHLAGVVARIEGLGPWAPAAFVALYAVATVAFIPGSILSLAAGALFGIGVGSLVVLLGATLGACAAFLIARYLARDRVEGWVAGDARFAAVDRAVGEDGRKIVFLLRLSPAFPFNLLNYALGLTRVRFADYLVASLAMIPGIVLYTYSGRLAGDVARVAAGGGVERGAGYYLVLALGLAATVAVTVLVTRRARRALQEATG